MKLPQLLLALIPLLLALGCDRPLPLGAESPTPPEAPDPAAKPGTLTIRFLDVGQGDAALARLPGGGTLLIDGGPPEAGTRVLAALREEGEPKAIDWLVGTHPHADHIGGLVDVLREIPARNVLDPGYNHGTRLQETYLKEVRRVGAKAIRARAGQTHELASGVRLEILAPSEPLLSGTDSDANNNSIVARLVYGDTAFLFTGDMENEERKRLLTEQPAEKLRAEVLKVSHHGSHNGTDPAFLRAVRPKYAVISLAAGNDYGHPHRETLEELKAAGVEVLRTDQRGTLTFTSDGKTVRLAGGSTPKTSAPEKSPPVAGAVFGHRTSKVYHTKECPSLPAPNNRVTLKSAAEAERQGFRPHRTCVKAGRSDG
ncbi:MAG: MBL fold metallo-hydrolase [Armatimonadota bacterium]